MIDYNKLVSVVMPVYNTGQYLRSSISSILNQTLNNFEFLIIDDFSDDIETLDILNSLNDSRIKILKNFQKGAANAYNLGIKNARSNFVAIVDHDDYFSENLLEKQFFILSNNQEIDIVGCNYNLIDENGKIIQKKRFPQESSQIVDKMLYKCVLLNSGSMIRKKIFEQFGYFKESFFPAQDYEFYLRVLDHVTFFNIQEYLINWRIRSSSPTQKDYIKQHNISKKITLDYINHKLNNNEITKKIWLFYKGRILFYHTPFTSFFYFATSLFMGNFTSANFIFLIKSALFIPLTFYRWYLLKFKFKKTL